MTTKSGLTKGVPINMFATETIMDSGNKQMWWGYLHQNGTLQLKRWWGDHADYTTDCYGNDFVQCVVKPFAADSLVDAMGHLSDEIRKMNHV